MDISAFGVEYKLSKEQLKSKDTKILEKMLLKSRGIGRLNLLLDSLDKTMDLILFKVIG